MTYDFTTQVEIDIEDLLDDMTAKERLECFDILRKKLMDDVEEEEKRLVLQDAPKCDPVEMAKEVLRELSPSELHRLFVDAFYVPSYYDDEALRAALEPIVTAR